METIKLLKGSDLSEQEKNYIIQTMLNSGEQKDNTRKLLSAHFNISEGTINSLIAHNTMKSATNDIQEKIYKIVSISGINDPLRKKILGEFLEIFNDHQTEEDYNYFHDIDAISDEYNINPNVLEEFLKNKFIWLGTILNKLKHKNKGYEISNEDKSYIRMYVELGSSKIEKKERRKEMAAKFGVSIYVIGAITAWKTGEDSELELIKNINIDSESNENDRLEEISKNVFTNDGFDIEFIIELSKDYSLDNEDQRNSFLENIYDCYPNISFDFIKEIIPIFSNDINNGHLKRNGEGTGVLMNYDNKIKNKWREKLKQYIDENTDKDKRKDMKVLCLPGIECLEIPLYLELGFKAENIIGIESAEINTKSIKPEMETYLKKYAKKYGLSFNITNKKSLQEIIKRIFIENAAKYGIQTRVGKLEEVIKTENTTFDVISLDFLGPISLLLRKVTHNIKYSEKVVLCTNFLNKREKDYGKKALHYGTPTMSNELTSKELISSSIHNNDGNTPSNETINKSLNHRNAIITNYLYESGKIDEILQKIIDSSSEKFNFDGNMSWENSSTNNFTLIAEIRNIILNTINIAFEKYKPKTDDLKINNFIDFQIHGNLSKINVLIFDLLNSKYILEISPKSKKSYQYKGGVNSTMFSDFFVIRTITKNELAKYNKVKKFLTDMLKSVLYSPGKNILQIERKNKKLQAYDLEDELVLKNEYGIVINKIKLRNIENARFAWKNEFGMSFLEELDIREEINEDNK